MALRMIATDLDGTLLSPGEVISDRTAAALTGAREAGITVVFATGRSHFSALPIIEGRDVVDWLLCSNGATLFDARAGEIRRRLTIDDASVNEIYESVIAGISDAVFAWETSEGFLWDPEWWKLDSSPAHYVNIGRVERTGPVPTDVTKVLVGVPGLRSAEVIEPIAALVPPTVRVASSGAPFVEITAADAHKGAALDRLCLDLDICADEVVAFGDNQNDLSMLQWAGRSVVMPHSIDLVRALADEIAPSNLDDGVAQVIERMLAGL